MLNISFLDCTKVELWDLKVYICSNWRKNLKSCPDLELGLTMSNIELVQVIPYTVLQCILISYS